MKEKFAVESLLGWQLFFFPPLHTLKILFYSQLASKVPVQKSIYEFISIPKI